MINIRSANSDDVAGISQCINNAYKVYVPRMGKSPGPMLDDYAVLVTKHIVRVAQLNDKIVGVLVLKDTVSPILLDNIAVDPEFQGTGLGKRLLALAEKTAQEKGFDSIQLYTHEIMQENIAYYLRQGYEVSHRITEKGYQRIYMCKRLID